MARKNQIRRNLMQRLRPLPPLRSLPGSFREDPGVPGAPNLANDAADWRKRRRKRRRRRKEWRTASGKYYTPRARGGSQAPGQGGDGYTPGATEHGEYRA